MALDWVDLLKKIRAFLAEQNHTVSDFLELAIEEHNRYLVSPDFNEEQYTQDVRGGRYAFEAMFAARMEALVPGQTQDWHTKNAQIWLARDVINVILERSKVNSFDADGLWWSFRYATFPFTKDDLHMIALLCTYGPLWCLMKGQARPSDVFVNTTPAPANGVKDKSNSCLEEGDLPHGSKEHEDEGVLQTDQVVEEERAQEDGEIADEEDPEEGEIVGEEDLNSELQNGALADTPDYDPFSNNDSKGTKEIDYSIEPFQVKEQAIKDYSLGIAGGVLAKAFHFRLAGKSKRSRRAGPQGKPEALELDKPDVETLCSHLVESLSLFVHSENYILSPPKIRGPRCNETILVVGATQLKTEGWVGDKIWYFLLHNFMVNYCQNWKSVEISAVFAALTTNPAMAVLANAGNILPLNQRPKNKFSIHTLGTFFEGFISIGTKTNPGNLLVWMDSSLPSILDHLHMKCVQYGLVGLTPSTSSSSVNYVQELRDLLEDQSNPQPLPYTPSPSRRTTIFSTIQWSETSSSSTTPTASPRKGLSVAMPVPVGSTNPALTPSKRKHSETNDLPLNGDEQMDVVNPMGEERPSQKAKSYDISDNMDR